MDWASTIWSGLGHFSTVAWIVAILAGGLVWLSGIGPILYRLGKGLATRKIAIFATGANLTSLRQMLASSGFVQERNLIAVPNIGSIDASAPASVYLLHWSDWGGHLDEVLRRKSGSTPLIVYQPYDGERIPADDLRRLDGTLHTAISNFRGRLLNDLLTSMMTTSYEKR